MLSNGEGFLMGIINGFGSMANRYIEDEAAVEKQRKLEEIKAQIREQEMRTQKELELEFAPQKAQVEAGIEEDARQKRVGIVDAALEDRAVDAVQKKYADPVMGDTPLTDEQQSVLNDGMAKNVREREGTRDGVLNSSMERMKATQDVGLKPDATVVTAEQKEDALGIREKDLDKRMTQFQARMDAEQKERERREKQGERTDALKADNLKLQGEKNENARISGLQSLITREEQHQEKIRQNFTAQYSKSMDAEMDPAKHAAQVNAAFMASPQYKASEKRIEELNGRLSKALEEKPKTPEPTPNAGAGASRSPYPDGQRLSKNGKIYIVRNGVPVPE